MTLQSLTIRTTTLLEAKKNLQMKSVDVVWRNFPGSIYRHLRSKRKIWSLQHQANATAEHKQNNFFTWPQQMGNLQILYAKHLNRALPIKNIQLQKNGSNGQSRGWRGIGRMDVQAKHISDGRSRSESWEAFWQMRRGPDKMVVEWLNGEGDRRIGEQVDWWAKN